LLFIFIKTLRLQPQPLSKIQLPSVAVIIPARNEARVLSACLDAALAQSMPIKTIMIADDGSTDSSPQLLQDLYGMPQGVGLIKSKLHRNISVLRLPHQGKAYALNAAWPLLDADIVVTLDADTILVPDAIMALAQAFAEQPTLAIAGGILQPQCTSHWSASFFEFFQKFEYIYSFVARAGWMNANTLLLVSGAFAAYRKDVLVQLNGFNPHSMVEDYEINHRMYRYAYDYHQDWTIGVVAGASAITDAPATVSNFFHQRQRWFAGFLHTQFANLDMTGNPKFGVIGRFMLPIKALDAIQPLLGVVALGLLIWLIFIRSPALMAIFWVVMIKLSIDLLFNLWALLIYHRWANQSLAGRLWIQVMIYTLLTPLSFQWLRHVGACLGWWSYLTKRLDWKAQR
ncbi:MAG: glycosyltransferase family 2 protein, partial [Candidatus Saccharibacteria bacterium]|nr:glycosyltransferase family 2 protein [Moraxellaceae bacterium]